MCTATDNILYIFKFLYGWREFNSPWEPLFSREKKENISISKDYICPVIQVEGAKIG